MIGPLLYLQVQSFRNRMRMRLQRLRKPKYLAGALVGLAYFYFYFFRHLLGAGRPHRGFGGPIEPDTRALLETAGALALLVIVFLAWLIPHSRAALTFTEAEIAFLFPAPISRRALIHFKLLKSQTAILFTTFFLTLVSGRFGSGQSAWAHAAGWWLILSTLNLHFLGSSFARTLLLDRGITNWKRRASVLIVAAAAVGAVWFWSRQTLRPPLPEELASLRSLGEYFRNVFSQGPALWLLFPFRLLVRPFLAPDFHSFLLAAWPAALLLLLHYAWVVRSNVAFEESSLALSRRIAERVSAVRQGNFNVPARKAARPLFTLHPSGPPMVALLWKNLIATGAMFNLRMLLILLVVVAPAAAVFLQGPGSRGLGALFGMLAGLLALWSIFLGPQMLRQDLRQDLPNADILKLYPLPGWQIVLGEMLAPVVVLSVIQWCLVLICALLFEGFPPGQPVAWPERAAIGLSAFILFPFLNLVSLVIPNAAVLFYPGWFQTSKEGPHGIEATGQRIIFVLGQMLVLLFALIPAAIAFTVGFLPTMALLGPVAAFPAGALGAALALTAESIVALLLLGRGFERLDISAESQA